MGNKDFEEVLGAQLSDREAVIKPEEINQALKDFSEITGEEAILFLHAPSWSIALNKGANGLQLLVRKPKKTVK